MSVYDIEEQSTYYEGSKDNGHSSGKHQYFKGRAVLHEHQGKPSENRGAGGIPEYCTLHWQLQQRLLVELGLRSTHLHCPHADAFD